MRRRLTALAAACLLLTGCTEFDKAPSPGEPKPKPIVPYDVYPLLKPAKKYLGVAYDGAGRTDKPLKTFEKQIGKRPNLVPLYADFDDEYPVDKVRSLWSSGVLPMIVWEPYKSSLQDIGAGVRDRHITRFAVTARDLGIPIVLNFAHEMNGGWYPWGTKKAQPADFLKAYRHVHDVFTDLGATNVIWVWSPNVLINNSMKLDPYWVGDAYADWVGPIGYFEWSNDSRSFEELFGPPLRAMRRFTRKPVLLPETAAPANANKPAHITDLYREVAARKDIVGVVWFNIKKERDWRVGSDPASLAAFRKAVSRPKFGFDPRSAS